MTISRDVVCEHCGQVLGAHCKYCEICNPREVDHPDDCPVQIHRDRRQAKQAQS